MTVNSIEALSPNGIPKRKITTANTASVANNYITNWDPRDYVPQQLKELIALNPPNYLLAFLNVVQQLKIQKRTGWLDFDVTECESIADHMYRMSVICMLITNKQVNRDRCIRIALVHDMAESLVGDITPVSPISASEKHAREHRTIEYLCNELIAPVNPEAAVEILECYEEYETASTLEARYVKDIDKYELFVQCFEYEKQYKGAKNFQDFFRKVPLLTTEEVTRWTNELLELRQQYFDSLALDVVKQ